MTFEDAFPLVVTLEGGYVNDPDDPGGETKFGISKAAYPHEDIANLTLDRAKSIYATDYWMKAGCDKLPEALQYDVFDMAVNSGVGAAVACLQRAVKAPVDGSFGPQTLMAVTSMSPYVALVRFSSERLLFVTGSPDFPKYGKGWVRRIATVMGRVS
jgi:lysozyme family protein